MGHYELLWNERKSFLKSSAIIAIIIAIVLTALNGYDVFKEASSFTQVLAIPIALIIMVLFLIATVSVLRMVFRGTGGDFAIEMLSGFWSAALSALSGGGMGMVIGFCIMVLFGILFAVVAAGYSIYLPISTIYYFVRYKQEVKQNIKE